MNDYEESSVENDTATQKADEVPSIDYRTSSIHYLQYAEGTVLLAPCLDRCVGTTLIVV
jgi:hypothetical protein